MLEVNKGDSRRGESKQERKQRAEADKHCSVVRRSLSDLFADYEPADQEVLGFAEQAEYRATSGGVYRNLQYFFFSLSVRNNWASAK